MTLQSLGTSVNGKQEESTVACVAMVYWYFKARGRTEQEAGARGVRRVETFTFHFSPSHPSFFLLSCPVPFHASCAVARKELFCRLTDTGVTSSALLVYY